MCAPIDEMTIAEWLNGQCLTLDLWLESVVADPAGDPDLAQRIETHRNWLANELLALYWGDNETPHLAPRSGH